MDWSYTRNDTVGIQLIAKGNPLHRGFQAVIVLMEALADAGLTPDGIGTTRTKKYSAASLKQAIDSRKGNQLSLWLVRRANPVFELNLKFNENDERIGLVARADIPMDYFADRNHGLERSAAVVRLFRAWTQHDDPIYGWAHSSADTTLGSDPLKTKLYAEPAASEPYWLNVYGAKLVQALGRERVLLMPAHFIEPLPDGGVLFTTSASPADFASEESRRAQARVMAHLLPDISYEAELARLMKRSTLLAPVEAKWDPDIADLIEKIVDFMGFSQRQQETAKWNQYRPPNVTEWIPTAEALPSDVKDERAAVREYEELYVEQLLTLIHKEVPADIRNQPEALPSVDFHFWQNRYPEFFRRKDIDEALIPAIGSYIGRMIVRQLGGRWVPRRNLDETQVVVRDRAWLPFLRARNYMKSTQSIVDHSLTQFFRDIERHR